MFLAVELDRLRENHVECLALGVLASLASESTGPLCCPGVLASLRLRLTTLSQACFEHVRTTAQDDDSVGVEVVCEV